jgi:hypothetical protein
MLGASTPFKIHDENEGEASLTGSKLKGSTIKKGLGGVGKGFKEVSSVHKLQLKKGLGGTGTIDVTKTPLAPKSVRKALGELSASHVNTQHRTMTGGLDRNPLGGTEKKLVMPPSLAKSKSAVSFEMASEAISIAADEAGDKMDAVDMICSQVKAEVDVYDTVMQNSSKMDVMLVTSTGVCDDSHDAAEEEQDWSSAFAPEDFMSDYGVDEAFPSFSLPAEELDFD